MESQRASSREDGQLLKGYLACREGVERMQTRCYCKNSPHWHKLVAKCLKSILHMTIRFSFTFHPGCCVTPHSGPPSCLSYSVTASNREITFSSPSTDNGSIWEFEGHVLVQHLNYCALSNLLLHSLHL